MGALKLSILIPAYNVEGLLSRCLDSVCMQMPDDVEVIIVNDGSTDQTLAVAESYVAQYPKIRLYSKENEGVGAARNQLLKLACGEYFWFVDADDYIEAGCVGRILNRLTASPDTEMLLVLYNDEQKQTFFGGTGEDYVLAGLFNGYLWNKVIKRSIVSEQHIRFMSQMYSQEDWMFLMQIYPNIKHVLETEIRAYRYCDDNANSVMRNKTEENIRRNVDNSLKTICHFKRFIETYKGCKLYSAYKAWLNYSTAGFLYSLLPLRYSVGEVKQIISTFKNCSVYPIGKSENRKADLFVNIANIEWLYLLLMRLWKKN
ncbi:MAG: glycosyltransferase family A protein [Prevotella sp.]|nr:glycosyltransferase family A protein [Prevotella sp.]